MAEIVALVTNAGIPLTGAGTVPTIRVRRLDTNALVETDSNMTEIGDGLYGFTLTTVTTLEYGYRVDADPAGSDGVDGQVTVSERYLSGTVSGIQDERIETDVPAILVDTGTTIPGLLTTIDTVVDAILVDTGTTIPGLLAAIDTVVDAILVDTGTTIPALIAGVPAANWGFDITGVTGVTFDTAAKQLNSLRMIQFNTLRPAVVGAPDSMVLLEDDNSTVKATFPILDVNNLAVVGVAGAAANRGVGV